MLAHKNHFFFLPLALKMASRCPFESSIHVPRGAREAQREQRVLVWRGFEACDHPTEHQTDSPLKRKEKKKKRREEEGKEKERGRKREKESSICQSLFFPSRSFKNERETYLLGSPWLASRNASPQTELEERKKTEEEERKKERKIVEKRKEEKEEEEEEEREGIVPLVENERHRCRE